jgi:hypothetical protein
MEGADNKEATRKSLRRTSRAAQTTPGGYEQSARPPVLDVLGEDLNDLIGYVEEKTAAEGRGKRSRPFNQCRPTSSEG